MPLMPMTCEQIDEQMIDFLYGELAPEARAAFDAHIGGCERCRREAESLGQTRALARASLDQAPPAHLRARVVAAARAAMTPAVAAAAASSPAAPAAAQVPRIEIPKWVKAQSGDGGFWRKLRAWWTLPTLVSVGAVAVFLLSMRSVQRPLAVMARGHRMVVGTAPPASEPTASEEAAPAVPAPAAPPGPPANELQQRVASANRAEKTKAGKEESYADRARVAPAAAARSPAPASSGAPAGAPTTAKRKEALGGGCIGRVHGGAPAATGRSRAPVSEAESGGMDDLLSGERAADRDPGAAPSARAAASPADQPSMKAAEPSAPPPAEAAASADEAKVASAESARPRSHLSAKKARRDEEADLAEPEQGDGALDRRATARATPKGYAPPAPPPAAPVAVPTPVTATRGGAGAAPPAASAPAPASPPPAPALAADKDSAAPAKKPKAAEASRGETLVQRADRLFTEGRWVEAAVAYRDLLRQNPNAPDASRWRRRLAAAQSAAAATTTTP